MLITNVSVFTGGRFTSCSNVRIERDRIVSIEPAVGLARGYLVPGFIDIHTHGALGEDVMNATANALEKIASYHAAHGVTTWFPTTLTASIPAIEQAMSVKLQNAPLSRIAGFHLEGPFLSPKASGAHPKNLLLNPTVENTAFITKNIGNAARITVAPDLPGAEYLTKLCTDMGIQVSLGHDGAIDDEIYSCISNGASSVTHLYNCTSRPSRRETPKKHLGLTEIGLIEKRLTAEVIADGKHVPDELFKLIYSIKGAKGIALISDSLAVAGMPAGDYLLGAGASAQPIRVEDGVAVLPSENTYAGSITSVGEMVARVVRLGVPLADVVTMATLTPARLTRLSDRGDIKPNMLADLNLIDKDGNIEKTYLAGRQI